MGENIEAVKPLTAQGVIQTNDNLIFECLELGNIIYSFLTNDNCLKEETQKAPNCMIENLSIQSENLKLLHDILRKIKINLIEGGN